MDAYLGSESQINPKMDMPKIVILDGFGVCADPREHFVKTVTLIIM